MHFLEKHLHIVRKHSSFGVIFGAIFLIVASCYYAALWIWQEAGELVQRLPVYYQALVQGLDKIAENLQSVADRMPLETREKIADFTEHFTDYLGRIVSSLGGGTVEAAGNAAKNIPSLLISFIFSLLFAYFFIAQRERVHRILRHVIPEQTREGLRMVWGNLKYAVGGYFRAQFKIMGVVGLILAAGFLFMQIDYAVLLAALIALMDFLPMLGTGTAPKMVGDSIGVDTLTTLFLLFVGYRVSGLLGMILAVPAGLIVLQLYEAGAFEHMMKNVRELMELIADWREPGDRE